MKAENGGRGFFAGHLTTWPALSLERVMGVPLPQGLKKL